MTKTSLRVLDLCCLLLLGSCSEETAAPPAAAPESAATAQSPTSAASAAPEAVALPADSAGRVAPEGNPLGIQGTWTARAGTGSNVTLSFDGASVCFNGQAGQIPTGASGAEYFGVVATLDFCRAEPASAPADGSPLSACASAPGLADKLVGVGFSVDAGLPPVLRAGFREQGRMDVPYVLVRDAGPVVALFADALVRNNPSAELPHPAQVQSIELTIPGARQNTRAFNFCLHDLAALTGKGWVSKEIPDWALEQGPGKQVELAGVNLAGAEFSEQRLPGTYQTDYEYPSNTEIDYYAAAGMKDCPRIKITN